jgi:broad specificity phosphatase PhoE
MRLIFITHPDVVVDPDLDVRRWSLSPAGRARMQVFACTPDLANVTAIWSSTETKARDAAAILSQTHALTVTEDADLGENDRSSTGFLPPPAFEAAADAFFAHPDHSHQGWERATDARTRIDTALRRIATGHLAQHAPGDLAIVAHGAVGTLMLCRLMAQPITRALDQPFQGHYWTASLPDWQLLHGWQPIAPRHLPGA